MTQLTEHFSLEEFTDSQTAARHGIHNVPLEGSRPRENLTRIADTMEKVRDILGHPVLISSGYRSTKVNGMVGGSKSSAHIHGLAADFTSPGLWLAAGDLPSAGAAYGGTGDRPVDPRVRDLGPSWAKRQGHEAAPPDLDHRQEGDATRLLTMKGASSRA